MACVCYSPCLSPENDNGIVWEEITRLKEMVAKLSPQSFKDLISHIDDGLKDIVIANNNVSRTRAAIVEFSTEFGRALVQYVLIKTWARKVLSLQNLGYDVRKVVSAVLEEAHSIEWMAVGLSVVAYVMDEMQKDSEEKSVYVQHLLYMLGLLKYMRQQNVTDCTEKMLKDAVNFIVLGSLLCIIRKQSENLYGFGGFSASVSKADMDNLEFRLMCRYPELAVGKILGKFPSAVPQYVTVVGANEKEARDEVIRLLDVDSDNRSRIAVVTYGQDGIGKTTIANAVFNRVQLGVRDYEVSRIELKSEYSAHDIKILQQQLLGDLFGKIIVLGSCLEGRAHLSNAFRDASRPVFIFIDNVQTDNVLHNFLPAELKWLPIHSRILITSTQRRLLSMSTDIEQYPCLIKGLGGVEGKNLLCEKVLGSADTNFTSDVNIDSLINLCNGIPLVLRMVATYLRHKRPDHVSACDHLLKFFEVYPTAEIDIRCSIVDFIYYGLDGPDKELFLDIAIFFNNWERHKLVYTFPDIQLRRLEESGLVMISHEGKSFVHDVVRERARAWSGKARITDAQQLINIVENESSQNLSEIKGIWLSEGGSEFQFEAAYLDSMHKSLRVIYLGKSIKVSGECKSNFEELRFFHMYNLPMDLYKFKQVAFFHGSLKKEANFLDLTQSYDLVKREASDFTKFSRGLQLAESLHVVELSDSLDLDRLPEGFNFFSALKEIDLSSCVKLRVLPDCLGQLKSLCKMMLTACSGLESLPETFGDLSSLEEIDFTNCSNLVSLPASFGQLHSLYYLQLKGCSELVSLPESFGDLFCLEELDLSSCKKLKSLPDSFHKLKSLSHLYLQNCSELIALPPNFGKLSALEELDLSLDDKLESLESGFGQLENLKCLNLKGCSNLMSLAANIGNLSSLEELELTGCDELKSLPDTFGLVRSLRVLKLCCSSLTELPVSMGGLSSLQLLTLTNCDKIAKLPNSLSQLKSLNRMHLEGCSEITEIPLPPLEELEITGCSNLIKLPDNIEQQQYSLRVLKLHGCSTLSELPSMLGKLPSLEVLVLNDCKSLKALPPSFSQLKSLRNLRLRGAPKLTSENVAAFPTSLETVDLSQCSSLQSLPRGFGNCTNLTSLLLDECSKLSYLPGDFDKLKSLRYLSIAGCTQLQALPDHFKDLTSLEAINASGCSALRGKEMKALARMKRLMFADIRESPKLAEQWKAGKSQLQEDLLAMLSKPEPEATMYTDMLSSFEPSTLAVVWLTMCDPDLDQNTSEIRGKISELRGATMMEINHKRFCRVELWQSDAVVVDMDDEEEIYDAPKFGSTFACAILGLWKLRDPELFNTLATLRTLLVGIRIPEEGRVEMEAMIPAFRKGRYEDVDVERWIDPKGGFIRILSPFLHFVSESVRKGTEGSHQSAD